MKATLPMLIAGGVALGGLTSPVWAETGTEHKVVTPQAVEWGPAPPSVPEGAQAAVLYGDPSKKGVFSLRLRLPEGYVIPTHTHPKPEIVTVVSGTLHLGMGERADKGKALALPAGSFFAIQPGHAHFVYSSEETVIQLNSDGPWDIKYLDPKDAPRLQG